MKLVKKTAEYSIYQRGDERYAVKGANKKAINGDDKVAVLLAEELIKAPAAAKPAEEAPAEEPVAEADAEAAAEDAPAADAE
ncbi:MAG: hypothetical protein KDI17_12760 [Halioglobus sp.]|nr:hypothetical protein [Halioglobus sp.]